MPLSVRHVSEVDADSKAVNNKLFLFGLCPIKKFTEHTRPNRKYGFELLDISRKATAHIDFVLIAVFAVAHISATARTANALYSSN